MPFDTYYNVKFYTWQSSALNWKQKLKIQRVSKPPKLGALTFTGLVYIRLARNSPMLDANSVLLKCCPTRTLGHLGRLALSASSPSGIYDCRASFPSVIQSPWFFTIRLL